MRKAVMMGIVGLLALLLAACSPTASPSNPRAVLEKKVETIDSTVQDLFEALDDAGLSGATAMGVVDGCQGAPLPGVSYQAGMGVTVGEQQAESFAAVAKQLEATGWTQTPDVLDGDEKAPMGRFTRGDITVDVKTGGFTYAGELQDEDRMTFEITANDACVKIPDDMSFVDFQDLSKEIRPRG